MRRIVPLLITALVCSGCFVFDELDAGNEILDKHSPRQSRDAGGGGVVDLAQEGDEDPGALERLRGWWETRQRANAREDRVEAARAADDPHDVIVACRLGGTTRFTRKSDCQSRGGRF